MADANDSASRLVESPKDTIQEILLAVFKEAAGGIRAKVCHLDHTGQTAINK